MGELADRYWNDTAVARAALPQGVNSVQLSSWAAIRDRIAELEARLERETQLAYMRLCGEHGDRVLDAASSLQQRAIDAEQRAAAAWAAVTELLGNGTAITSVSRISSTSLSADSPTSGWHTRIELVDPVPLMQMQPASHVAVLTPSLASRNPDLLERASVELAEAYQRAKAEEQRQAEERQAGPLATTASMDVIAKDFAEGVVAHIKAEAEAERKHPAFGANPSTATAPTDTVTR